MQIVGVSAYYSLKYVQIKRIKDAKVKKYEENESAIVYRSTLLCNGSMHW